MGAMAKQQLMGALKSSVMGWAFQILDRTTIRTKCTKAKISSTHDRAFEQHLTDHGIHHVGCSQKPNLEDVLKALSLSDPSTTLSLSQDFEIFLQRHRKAKDEAEVVASVIPIIMGDLDERSHLAINKMFRKLDSLTDDTIPSAKPDFCCGALPDDLHPSIRNELDRLIIPKGDTPILPNFFLEVKGPDGRPSVATRQARHDGAIGARAMHSLQNHMQDEPIYDDNVYAFSSTYQDGHLVLFAHHLTAPTTPGGRPEYHMTQVKSFALTSDTETFTKGVTAFRNLCDLAKRHRDASIKDANSRHAIASGQGKNTDPRCPKTLRLPVPGENKSKTAS